MAIDKRIMELQIQAVHNAPGTEVKPVQYYRITTLKRTRGVRDLAVDAIVPTTPASPPARMVETKAADLVEVKKSGRCCSIM